MIDIENCTYRQLYIHLTSRCNMNCNVCYDDGNVESDITTEYFEEFCKRLPNKVIIRALGGEPTLHEDLSEIIKISRKYHHIFSLITNGKKLADYDYAKELKNLNIPFGIAISFDGGISNNEIYQTINNEPCAEWKMQALENLAKLNFRRVAICAILIRGLNEFVISDLIEMKKMYPKAVRFIHLRSMGKIGKFIDIEPYSISEMSQLLQNHVDFKNGRERAIFTECEGCPGCDRRVVNGLEYALIDFPNYDCKIRGHLMSDLKIKQFFENIKDESKNNIEG